MQQLVIPGGRALLIEGTTDTHAWWGKPGVFAKQQEAARARGEQRGAGQRDEPSHAGLWRLYDRPWMQNHHRLCHFVPLQF